jgi:DNA-binding MltR family transcriptional regulator
VDDLDVSRLLRLEAKLDSLIEQVSAGGRRRGQSTSPREIRGQMEAAAAEMGVTYPPGVLSDEVFELQTALYAESDRGCALIAAAFLDSALEQLLRAFFVDDSDVANGLLRGRGGLSSFSARIDQAYLVGLIAPLAKRDLHLVRKIRNDFAHTGTEVRFTDAAIAARCSELKHDIMQEALPPRRKFERVVLGLCGVIVGARLNSTQCKPAREHRLGTPELIAKVEQMREIMVRRMSQ